MPLTPVEREMAGGRLAALAGDVRLALRVRPTGCDTCADTRALLQELAALSPRLTLEVAEAGPDGGDCPAIDVLGLDHGGPVDYGVRLVGAPLEFELTSLLDAILTVGSREPSLSAESLARLAALDRPVHVQVFSTPTCRYCPAAVSLAHRIALASPFVTATANSVIEFPDLIRRYRVTGVPKIVVGEGVELLGAQPEAVFVDAVVTAGAARATPSETARP
jgi:glutaredoxin-like protein